MPTSILGRIYRLRLIVQPDGRILVAGDFTALGGGSTGTTTRNRLGRLVSYRSACN